MDNKGNGVGEPIEAPEYLTVAQVSNLLEVSEKSLYRWAKDDSTMPVLRVGGTVRFPRERLLRWLRDREQGRQPRRPNALDENSPVPPSDVARLGASEGEAPRSSGSARGDLALPTGGRSESMLSPRWRGRSS